MRDPDCVFCQIIDKKIPSVGVYEDEMIYAFKDIHPQAPFHALIVPKDHIENAAALAKADPATFARIAQVAQQLANEVYNGSFRMIYNTGADAGQTVFHAHAHVLSGEKLPE